MKEIKLKSFYGICCIALLFFSKILNAQSSINEIEEVVVNASLVPINSERSANAISIIDYEQIKNRAVSSISDLLRNVPGLAVSKSGVQGSQTQIRVRGSEANHLLVLIDGIEANNPAQGDELNWGTLASSDIERIEVIRGPQSSMFGSDALSGVINIITKSASSPKSLRIFSEKGSLDTQNTGASIGFRNDSFDARLGLSQIKTDGDNISRIGNEKDGYENKNLTVKSGWRINEKLKTSFSARRSDGMNEYDSDVDFDGLVDDQDKVTKFENSIIGLKVDYLDPEKKWQHHASFAQSTNDNKDFQDGLLGTETASTKDQIRFISSLYWGKFAQRMSILTEYENEKFKQRGPINDYGVYGIFDPNQDQKRITNSIAIEYRADVLDNITLAASTRRDDNSEFKNSNTFRFEIIYNLSNQARLRSAYGTAIKNPTFTERFGFYTNFIGNQFLQPEKSTNWEIGLDKKFFNGNINLSVTLFNSELENEIDGNVFDPMTFGYTAANKSRLSKRNGLEINSLGKLSKNITISGSYTFTDSQELDASGAYQNEIRRPRHISSLNLSWQQSDDLNINTNFQYNGSQTDIVYPSNLKLAEFILVNVSATFNISKKLDAYLRLENLFDESYEEIFGYQTLGFGAHMGLRYRL
jgi:vitamin B12 transporter